MLCHIEIPPEYAAGLNLNSPEHALPRGLPWMVNTCATSC
ncbi:MAG: hypothetical protein RLZZ522_1886 [Verrucomicrobiota bacterium]